MSFATIASASFMATGIYNFDSSRFRAAPLDKRKEGWTEAWGASDLADASLWKLDEESISLLLATPHPQLPIVLTQFRPAWLEQLVLRMTGIPHIVINSAHVANEATGPLPYLRDHASVEKAPALVGRHHPSNIAPPSPMCRNSILDYLISNRSVNLDASLASNRERSLSKVFLNLIHTELQCGVLYLRYEDHNAWEQVYRRQYLNASSPNGDNWILHLKGRFQACLERAASRKHLVEYSRHMSVKQVVGRAKEAYQALEDQLLCHNGPFLLGNDKPSLVDAVLWAHLADALCDVNLVVVLGSFPGLVKYFQHMYKTYFTQNMDKWGEWNQQQNMNNAFQQLPVDDKKKLFKTGFKDAIELMQSLSLRHHDLQDVLDAAKSKRAEEPWPVAPPTESLLYRWRMGDSMEEKPQDVPEDKPENPMRQKLIRDQQRNDQVWISGVAGVSAIVILLLQGASEDKE